MPNIRCPKQEPEMLKKRASQSWLRAVPPRRHTLPLARPLLQYPATVCHSQAFILGTKFDTCFGNCFWSQLCAMIFTISSPAGRSFLAGGLHFVTIFVPSFGHRFWSQFWAPGCPQIQGLLMNLVFVTQFWAPDLAPRTGPQNLTILCPGIRIRFNQILKKI